MAYYMAGDYYLGAGDPGLFGFLKKAAGAVTGVVSKIVPGPVGMVAGVASRVLGGGAPPQLPMPTGVRLQQRGGFLPAPALTFGPRGAAAAAAPTALPAGGGCPPGYHLDKRTKSYCVRNRRMNPANSRALRRALRREQAFVTLAKRTGLVTVPKAKRLRKRKK